MISTSGEEKIKAVFLGGETNVNTKQALLSGTIQNEFNKSMKG